MHYGVPQDTFTVEKLFGQLILVTFIFCYMWFDREAVQAEEEENAKGFKYSQSLLGNDELNEEQRGLLKLGNGETIE